MHLLDEQVNRQLLQSWDGLSAGNSAAAFNSQAGIPLDVVREGAGIQVETCLGMGEDLLSCNSAT